MRRRVHRILGLVLLAPILVWTTTGLLFHLKPGWDAAYASLDGTPPDAALDPAALIGLDRAIAAARGDLPPSTPLIGARLLATDLGPLWRVELGGEAAGSRLVDAQTGTVRSPLDEAAIRQLITAAVARADAPARYGEPGELAMSDDEGTLAFAGGAVVTVGRADARLAQRGRDTDRIDWLYRMHYLQWTGVTGLDRALGLFGLVALVVLAVIGITLLRPLRRRDARVVD